MVVITGPTGVGKSEIAVDLAERFNGEIVGADSRQVYRHLEIGTAKPDVALRSRVPHHLIDFLDPAERFDLASFQHLATEAIAAIQRRGRLPFLVGGTLQYLRSITAGWQLPEAPPDPARRAHLEERLVVEGTATLYAELLARDPEAGPLIDPRNGRRIVRALEVCLATGRPFSGQRQSGGRRFEMLKIALTGPRERLYERVDQRAEWMFAAGLIEEVAGLLAAGYDPRCPAFSSIGYREAVDHLQGRLTAQEALDRLKFGTHRYIRQQFAWLRREPDLHWITVGPNERPAAVPVAARLIEDWQPGTSAED